MINPDETVLVFESWDCMVKAFNEAIAANDWELWSEMIHSGGMAVEVDGLPRVIDGTVH